MTVEKVESITKEQFEELMNAVKSLQEENKVLKAHADETIEEKRKMKAKHEAEKADMDKQLEAKVNRTKEENEQLIKQYKEQNEKQAKEINDFKVKDYNSKIDTKALELAQQLAAKNPNKAALLAKEFKERIKLDDDGNIKVLDTNGNLTISPVDSLVSEYSTKYAFLCDGVESTGGGSHSSAGAQVKKYSEMSESERVELKRSDANKFTALRQEFLQTKQTT